MTTEPRDVRLKRLMLRSMRRGIKEMDLILSHYARQALDCITDDGLHLYYALLW